MAWLVLIVAGLFEVGWAACLKSAAGFTRPWPTAGFVAFMLASMALLSVAMRTLPLGTAYAAWTGIGAVGAVAVGIAFWGEPADARRLASVALIVAGIAGLKLATPH